MAYAALRLWRLTDSCLWFDEIFSVHAAEHSWSGMWWFIAQDLIHPPLFYALLKSWIGIGGESLLWLRLFPVFWATVALFPFLHLCRELKLKLSASAIALALFAVNGALIKYAQEVRMYSLLLCLSLFSIWLFARFFYRGKNIWILTALNILLVYTHYFGWLVVASEVLVILILQRIKIRHVLVMSGIAAASFIPWLVVVLRAAGSGSHIGQNIGWVGRPGIQAILDLVADLVEPFYYEATSVDPSSNLYISIPILLVIGVAKLSYLFRLLSFEEKKHVYLLEILAGVPIFLALAMSWVLPYSVWGSRHLIITFAPVAILIAIFLTGTEDQKARTWLLSLLGVFTLAAFVVTAMNPPREQVWCAWETAAETEVNRKDRIIYAFEDLSAYHLWFATRRSSASIVKVNGIDAIVEDKAYFLPRGSEDLIRVIDAKDVPDAANLLDEKVYFAFRDTTWNEHHQPIDFFKSKGYSVRQVFASDRLQGMQVFLGEATR